jgi:hypothetical protein
MPSLWSWLRQQETETIMYEFGGTDLWIFLFYILFSMEQGFFLKKVRENNSVEFE